MQEFVGTVAEVNRYPEGQVYTVQQKAWVDCHVFLLWINSVWSPFCTGASDSSYLLLDEFSVHMMSDCIQAIQGCGMEVEFIPGGLDKGVKTNELILSFLPLRSL